MIKTSLFTFRWDMCSSLVFQSSLFVMTLGQLIFKTRCRYLFTNHSNFLSISFVTRKVSRSQTNQILLLIFLVLFREYFLKFYFHMLNSWATITHTLSILYLISSSNTQSMVTLLPNYVRLSMSWKSLEHMGSMLNRKPRRHNSSLENNKTFMMNPEQEYSISK